MRRFPAILLVTIFGFSLIGPALVAEAGARVPACCRRDGQHHCVSVDTPGSGLKAVGAKCAEFPRAGAFALHSDRALPGAAPVVFRAMVQQPAVAAQAAAGYRISFSRSRQKRGPPSLFS